MVDRKLLDIAATIPVRDSAPVNTPAAKMSETTAITFGACAAIRSRWSGTPG